MNWTPNIFSILKTWVFKKKLLKFSSRFAAETQACFYCPEMCRFSCPTAEALRTNAATPRGKVSIVHWMERGEAPEKIAGSREQARWFLEQCTGCGRCTEYCLHENDVGKLLREARRGFYDDGAKGVGRLETADRVARGDRPAGGFEGKSVFFCEKGRSSWWNGHPSFLERLGGGDAMEWDGPHREWLRGEISDAQGLAFLQPFWRAKSLCFESPEAAWFFASLAGIRGKAPRLRLVWQEFFADFQRLELRPEQSFHESYHLSRLLPRSGVSVPSHERGLLPQHSGWNVIDCGGEGWYKSAHPEQAGLMRDRFFEDLRKDGRAVEEIICQSWSCVEHLRDGGLPGAYWLDLLAEAVPKGMGGICR